MEVPTPARALEVCIRKKQDRGWEWILDREETQDLTAGGLGRVPGAPDPPPDLRAAADHLERVVAEVVPAVVPEVEVNRFNETSQE